MLFSPLIQLFLLLYGPPIDRIDIWDFQLSRYYTVVPDQRRYYMNNTFEDDFNMNCSWDCFVTASGHRLTEKDEFKIVACPRSFSIWSELYIDTIWNVRCEDRWWSIKWKRLDLWTWIWDKGLTNIWSSNHKHKTGIKRVYLLKWSYEEK